MSFKITYEAIPEGKYSHDSCYSNKDHRFYALVDYDHTNDGYELYPLSDTLDTAIMGLENKTYLRLKALKEIYFYHREGIIACIYNAKSMMDLVTDEMPYDLIDRIRFEDGTIIVYFYNQ